MTNFCLLCITVVFCVTDSVLGCAMQPGQSCKAPDRVTKEQIYEREQTWESLWNQNDLNGLVNELNNDQTVLYLPDQPPAVGRAAILEQWIPLRAAAPVANLM